MALDEPIVGDSEVAHLVLAGVASGAVEDAPSGQTDREEPASGFEAMDHADARKTWVARKNLSTTSPRIAY